jgi:ribosome-binding protein aMBF1 (putative translation factor)
MSKPEFLQKMEDAQEKMEIQKAKNFKQRLREETKSNNREKLVDANNMTTTPMTIGLSMSKRFASARTAKGLTQLEAARKMNISLKDYNNFEKNGAIPND